MFQHSNFWENNMWSGPGTAEKWRGSWVKDIWRRRSGLRGLCPLWFKQLNALLHRWRSKSTHAVRNHPPPQKGSKIRTRHVSPQAWIFHAFLAALKEYFGIVPVYCHFIHTGHVEFSQSSLFIHLQFRVKVVSLFSAMKAQAMAWANQASIHKKSFTLFIIDFNLSIVDFSNSWISSEHMYIDPFTELSIILPQSNVSEGTKRLNTTLHESIIAKWFASLKIVLLVI